MKNHKQSEKVKVDKSKECFVCKYDHSPNYRLCMDKYKNFDHPCFEPIIIQNKQ